MKFIPILLLLTACSTYVPIKFRSASDFTAAKNSSLSIVIDKELDMTSDRVKILKDQIGNEINRDGWWKYAKENDTKKCYELHIHNFKTSAKDVTSSTEKSDKKIFRSANIQFLGTGDFDISKPGESSSNRLSVTVEGFVTSKQEMPEPHGNKSLAPIFESLLGVNREAVAISQQDMFLSLDADNEAKNKLILAILSKITPAIKTVNVVLEDDKDDMTPLKHFLNANDFESAKKYLIKLNGEKGRSDILYNLGVVLEAQGLFIEACPHYEEAYQMIHKNLYLEQKVGCESRLQHYKNISISK